MTRPRPGARPHKPSAVTPERLEQAQRLLEDGVSYRETARTTGITHYTLRKHFPGKGWTYKEAGEFRQLIRHVDAAA